MEGVRKRRPQRIITWEDRQLIEKMLKTDCSINQIAQSIGTSRTAIYYELERGGHPYNADTAQKNLK